MIRLADRDDLDELFTLHSDAEVTRYVPHMHWTTRADADAWFARLLERREKQSAVQCVIVRRATANATEAVIGTAVLFNFEVASGLAEIGYLLERALGQRLCGRGCDCFRRILACDAQCAPPGGDGRREKCCIKQIAGAPRFCARGCAARALAGCGRATKHQPARAAQARMEALSLRLTSTGTRAIFPSHAKL